MPQRNQGALQPKKMVDQPLSGKAKYSSIFTTHLDVADIGAPAGLWDGELLI